MASLMGIPPELLGPICAALPPGDILSLCRSCKYLYSVAHPLLFRHITIEWRVYNKWSNKDRVVLCLLVSILRNPSYAKYIQTVDIPCLSYLDCERHSRRIAVHSNGPPLGPQDEALVQAAIDDICPPNAREQGLPDTSDWGFNAIRKGHMGATIALILAQCTNLQSLTVDHRFIPASNVWMTHVMRMALLAPEGTTRVSRFHKLTHVTVLEVNDQELNPKLDPELDPNVGTVLDPGADLPQAPLLLFYLPGVTTFCFDYVPYGYGTGRQLWDTTSDAHRELTWPLADPPRAESLTTLRLHSTTVNGDVMEFLLRHTPNLHTLVYDCRLPSSVSPLNLHALRRGLDHVRDSLAHLIVKFDIYADEAADPSSLVSLTWGSLGPLGNMTALVDLEVSPFVLLGQVLPQTAPPLAGALPRGLKRLTFNDDLWDYNAFFEWEGEPLGLLLRDLFEADTCKTAIPLLEEFVLDIQHPGSLLYQDWANGANRESFQRLVETQGIRCSIDVDWEE